MRTAPLEPPSVMHLVDSLEAGGQERVAVNLANLLPRDRYRTYLCTTRHEGALATSVAAHVRRVQLERRSRFDLRGIQRLVSRIAADDVTLLHAHGSAVFIAAVASCFAPYPALVWHDHYGRYLFNDRPTWLYRLASHRMRGVIAVNRPLATWAESRLAVPSSRVWYVPNFVVQSAVASAVPELPGVAGARITCVANLRPQKDHQTLLVAMAQIVKHEPRAHLLLVGTSGERQQEILLRELVDKLGLQAHVSLLGHRDDVRDILLASDIGTLSSRSEGFPLALVEYGHAGLACVATSVGQCAEVLDEGRAGLLVPPGRPDELAHELIALLRSPARRSALGARLRERVGRMYTQHAVLDQICHVYDVVLRDRGTRGDQR
jgi:glycosyltransferase involved in cell wall biosynthesis